MKTRALNFITILFICFLAQGCAGVVVCCRDTTSINKPSLLSSASLDSVFDANTEVEFTAQWLKSHWGPPQSVSVTSDSSEEKWTYEFERQCWCGIVPMVILPVPLVVPTGKEKIIFLIRNDRVVSAKQIKWQWVGAGFFLLSPEGPWVLLGTDTHAIW